jgi:PAS domain S-box-containing protein
MIPLRSLRFRIIAMLLFCAAGVLLINMAYSYLSQKQQLRDELEQNAAKVVSRLAFTMAQPLWNFDQQHLEQLEQQELKKPAVLSVLVLANDPALLSIGLKKTLNEPEGIQPFSTHTAETAGTLHHERPIQYNRQLIGSVHVVLSDHAVRQKLASLILQQTVQALFILIGISLLTYLGLSKLLLAPLRELHQTTEALGRGDLTSRSALTSHDEIGQLGTTLNLMAEQLATTISGLKQAEDNLRSSNQRLNDIIEFIPDAMFVVDGTGVIIAWNHAIEEMTGTRSEQMLGKGDKEYSLSFFGERRPILIDLLDLPESEAKAHYTSVNREGDKIYGESFIPDLHGRQNVHLWGVAAPLYNSVGIRVGAIEIIRDITKQKQAELALKESEEFRRKIFESSPLAITIIDAETRTFIDCNQTAAVVNGFAAPEELIGKTVFDVLAPVQYDGTSVVEIMEILYQALLKNEKATLEMRHQRLNGEQWDAEVHLVSFISKGCLLVQATTQDVTERKRTNALMVQTEKMMMVGGLAAGMAHEINNPLGIITQNSQNIQRRFNPALPANQTAAAEAGINLLQLQQYLEDRKINQFITSIREATDRAARIIANMLKFSRKSESYTESVDLAQLVDQVIELANSDYDLKKNYDFKRVSIIKEFTPNLPKVPITTLEIEQVLLNLFKNAAQAMYEAGTPEPRLTLRIHQEEPSMVIEVEDNGPGISKEIQHRVFEPFFTTKPVGTGTGLGLSVSYAIIVNNHHGQLTVRSQTGIGTCFRISLPLERESMHHQGVSSC